MIDVYPGTVIPRHEERSEKFWKNWTMKIWAVKHSKNVVSHGNKIGKLASQAMSDVS